MATLQASRIRDALAKARSVGKIEEPMTLAGCEIVLQNLTPVEFESILEEIADYEDLEYAYAYQVNHVARSIVELNGMDLRDVDFVEEEVPAEAYLLQIEVPTAAVAEKVEEVLKKAGLKLSVQVQPPVEGGTRTVQIERYQWLRDYVLVTWSREALTVAWRKFMELLVKADAQVKEGIEFTIPDETAEEKLRRLLNEMREATADLPDEMVDALLSENDLLRKSSQRELDQVAEHVSTLKAQASSDEPEEEVEAQVPLEVQRRMDQRRPLNQQEMTDPAPAAPTQSAQRKAAVPAQIRDAAYQNSVGVGRSEPAVLQPPESSMDGQTRPAGTVPAVSGIPTRSERAAQIAELEAQVDPSILGPLLEGSSVAATPPRQVAELTHPQAPIDGKAVVGIVDKPPTVGINKKYNPRNRG